MRTCDAVALRIAAQGARLEVEWSDGPTTAIEGARLRAACRCEQCRKGLPREGFSIADAEPVGPGAIRVQFTDRHTTVFTVEALRDLAALPLPPPAPSGPVESAAPESPLPPGWTLEDNVLQKTFSLATFPRAISFLVEVACLAEAANHHPDVHVSYNKVTFSLTTHDEGNRVTEKDLRLALEIEGIAR